MLKKAVIALFLAALASCSAENPFQSYYSQMYLNEGNRFYNDGDYAKAVEFYTKSINMKPQGDTRFYSHYLRGYSYYYLENYPAAVEDLTAVIRMSADFDTPYVVRGNCFALRGQNELALSDFDRALELNPSNADAWLDKGNVYYSQELPQRAIEYYTSAIKYDPLMDEAYRRLADMLGLLDLTEQALSNYTAAIKINPLNRPAYAGRARLYAKKHMALESRKDEQTAKNIALAEAKDLWKKALASLGRGESGTALRLYGKALELDPTGSAGSGMTGDLYYDRGIVFLHEKQYDKALIDFRQAVSLNAKHWKALSSLGICYYELGYNQKSSDLFSSALKLNPKDDLSWFYLGKASLSLGDTDLAIAAFSSAVRFDPDLLNAYLERGGAYVLKGDYENAVVDFNYLLEKGWSDPSILLKRGSAYDALGMFDDAIADYSEYIRSAPKTDANGGYYLRANAFMGMKKYALAYRDYLKYVTYSTNNRRAYDTNTVEFALKNMDRCYQYLVKRRKI